MKYNNIAEIQEANHKARQHFFSPSAMVGFKTKVLPYIWHGKYFITSEKQDEKPRVYTIRFIDENSIIKNHSQEGQYKTSTAARKAASKIAE